MNAQVLQNPPGSDVAHSSLLEVSAPPLPEDSTEVCFARQHTPLPQIHAQHLS